MAEQIILEYKVLVDGLKADMKAVQTSFKETEKAGVTAAKNTETAFVKVEEKTKSLRTQLKELKLQLANATDPKDIERLAKAAGKLTDQLEDASDAARVFASESKFEQMGTALGSVGSKLRNLDFKGAADQSKLLVSASKSITFKDALTGIKDLGGTLLNIGKALLMNPLFLIGGAVIAIIANFDKLKNSGGAIGSLFTGIGNILGGVKDAFFALTDAIGLTDTATDNIVESQKKLYDALGDSRKRVDELAKAADKFNLQQLQASGQINSAQSAQTATLEKYSDALDKIQDERIKQMADLREANKEELANAIKNGTNAYNFAAGVAQLEKQLGKEAIAAEQALNAETALNTTNALNAEKLKKEEKAKELLALQQKIAKETKAIQDKLAKELEKLREAQGDFELSETLKTQKELEVLREAQGDFEFNEAKKNQEKLIKLRKGQYEHDVDLAKKAADEKAAIEQASIDFTINGLNAIGQITSNRAQADIQDINDKTSAEITALDSQLKNKLISQEQYDKKKDAIEANARKKESDIKRRQFEIDKQIAIITAIINTAVAVVKAAPVIPLQILAAATGALQIAVIASQPTPKFAKGVVGLKGSGTSTSDSIHAMLSKNESVVTSEATNMHRALLEAMNKNQGQKYIHDFYIAPALKAQLKKNAEFKDSSFAANIAHSMALHSVLKDGNLLDSLKQSRKSDRENAIFIAKAIASQNQNKRNW